MSPLAPACKRLRLSEFRDRNEWPPRGGAATSARDSQPEGPQARAMIDFEAGVSLYPQSTKGYSFMRLSAARAFAGLLAAAPILVSSAFAQAPENAAADAAIACLDIENTQDRLACLEAAARELKATRVVIEQENAVAPDIAAAAEPVDQQALEDSFGAEALDTTKREKREKQKKFKLTAKVVEFRVDRHNDITATLENGQVWRQLRGDSATVIIPPGERLYTVTIKKGPLGNYRMRIDQMQRWIRVSRVK
ncbi:MAG TPA: hypothetical protein DEA40_08685 [Parvularcula sp.]|nr:hypothetical protein [Parvularcula sp.]HBS35852.1 hypothetical protein [Parvularcula sp.]